ncbi:MAG TPA: glutamate formiminotransferase, partial [Chloroflexia bacterium]|nr:glutamate formiminotransferase [Chloroflexia bacterium]
RAFELVRLEAERYGVRVVASEVIGLVPLDALLGVADHYLRLKDFSRGQVLEARLLEE